MNPLKAEKEWIVWGGTLLTMDPKLRVIPDGVITIREGKIAKIESSSEFTLPKDMPNVDARGCLVLPGFVNGHTHAGMTLLRGIANDLPLHQWLHQHIFPLERKLGSQEFVTLGTQLACLEMIRGGTTLFNDMYYFEEAAARAVHEMGLRAICGQTHIEIGGVETGFQVKQKFDDFLKKIEPYPLVKGAVAPHSIYGLSESLWKDLVKYAHEKDLMIHTHLCETKEEVEKVKAERGLSPVEWFDSIGLFEQKSICAHAVELSCTDIALLGKKKVGIAYNPESNLKLGNGICPVVELKQQGASIAFGTDSTASNNDLNLLSEAGVGTKLQTFKYGVGNLNACAAVKILTIEGAKALSMDNLTGSLEEGKSADFIVMEVNRPHCIPIYDWYSHLIYSAQQSDIRDTVVSGRILMKDRKVLVADEASILERARAMGQTIQALNSALQEPKAN